MNNYQNKHYPVEYLIFQVADSTKIESFIELDDQIWTSFLSKQPGFISKEVWINENQPGEIHTILIWENMDGWKSIELSELKRIDQVFKQAFGSEFMITRRVHSEYHHGLYKVKHVQDRSID